MGPRPSWWTLTLMLGTSGVAHGVAYGALAGQPRGPGASVADPAFVELALVTEDARASDPAVRPEAPVRRAPPVRRTPPAPRAAPSERAPAGAPATASAAREDLGSPLPFIAALAAAPPARALGAIGTAPEPAPAPQPPVREVREVDRRPVMRASPPPRYPMEALRLALEGDVRVSIVIGPDGRVTDAVALDDPGHGLREAALEAARDLRFRPAMHRGRPVAVRARWICRFELP